MKQKKYLVALDQGTTSSRAVLFGLNGVLLAQHSIEFPQIYPQPGWVEHDPKDILNTVTASLRLMVNKAGIDPEEIAAIGITNQRETAVLWDRETGEPVYNAIVWQCRRTAPIVEKLVADGLGEHIRETTGLIPDAYFAGTKLKWLLDLPGVRERARRGELCFGTIDSFLAWNLLEGRPHVTDAANASRTMLLNIRTLEWDETLLQALEDCVLYQVNGPYRDGATGLSCYYPYSGDRENADIYAGLGTSQSVGYLYEYALSGSLSQAGADYMAQAGETVETPAQVESAKDYGLEDSPVYVDENGNAVLDIGPDAASLLQGVYFNLCWMDETSDTILILGYDNDLDADWDSGVFRDNFRGVWGCLDGALCYTELVYEGEDYNLYSVPILLNGEKYQLRVAYQYDTETFHILGARQGLEDSGMADRNPRELQPGDQVTLLHYAMTISGDETEPELYEGETITVTADTAFAEEDLGDGVFALCFEMTDQTGESFLSDLAWFTVEDGTIYTSA